MLQKSDRLFLPVSLKKREPSNKHPKTKLSLLTEVGELYSETRKLKNFIVKFQNIKHKLLSSESPIRKLM